MASLFDRLKERKLIQWALAYIAGAWVVAQVLDVVVDPWGLPAGLVRATQTVLALAFPVAVVLAWYHGEKGHQRVTKSEVAILTVLLVAVGAAFVALDPMAPEPGEVAEVREPPAPNSIVVLPFRDLSLAGDQEYMGYGVADEVLNLLHQVPAMRPISQNTAFAVAERGSTTPEIAELLNVAHVLEGSVAAVGDSIRISAQLIDPRADTVIFSRRFEGTIGDIWALQESIAAQVVDALQVSLLGPMPTLERTDPEAYRTFLQAKHIADQTWDNYETALRMFEEVLAVDPDHWPTLLEVAVLYMDWIDGNFVSPEEGSRRAREAIDRTLEIDPEIAYALALRASTQWQFDLDFEGAAALLDRARRVDPTHQEVLMLSGNFLTAIGRADDAVAWYERVRSIDPLYPINLKNLIDAYFFAERYDDAAEASRNILEVVPGRDGGNAMLGAALVELGAHGEALAVARQESHPVFRMSTELVALHALGRLGDFEIGMEQLEAAVGGPMPQIIGLVYGIVGEHDLAFEWLDRTSPRSSLFPAVVPWLSAHDIADDPRWDAFRERVGQSEERLNAIEFDGTPPGG